MSHRHIKLLVMLLGAGFCVATVYVVCWAVMAPYPVDTGVASSDLEAKARVKRDAVEEPLPPLELRDFEPLWGRKYRPPLVDPKLPPSAKPTTAPPVVTGPPPQLDLELVATIVEASRSRAVFSGLNGRTLLGGVGDKLGEGPSQIEIVQIDTRSVVVQHFGRQLTLELKKNESVDDEQGLDARRNR